MLGLLFAGCAAPPPPILLVTLDTTRADALGAYGGPATPTLDGLAARGVRFGMALTHAPTTLSAHASMFTGLDPHGHRVPRNGFALDPAFETVAERLSAGGYHTVAVIGGSVLGRGTGIEQGFSVMDAQLTVDQTVRYEASAGEVVARALERVDERDREKPLFLWVHFFDPHAPYAAPEARSAPYVQPGYVPSLPMDTGERVSPITAASRAGTLPPGDIAWYRGQYQGEVATVDAALGALLEGLEARGVAPLVVVAGDHGEMLFEEPLRPLGHGPDVDLVVSRVPMIIAGAGTGVVDTPVALSDLGPTLLGLAGLPPGLGGGRDLGPALRGEPLPERPIFLEATRPTVRRSGWNNLATERGVVWRGHLLILSPLGGGSPSLWRLEAGQPADPAMEVELLRALTAWDAQAPPWQERPVNPALSEALRALGYEE